MLNQFRDQIEISKSVVELKMQLVKSSFLSSLIQFLRESNMPDYSRGLWHVIPEQVHPLMWEAYNDKVKVEIGEIDYNLNLLFLQDLWFDVVIDGDV